MSDSSEPTGDKSVVTPVHLPPPQIAAVEKDLDEPVMVRTVTDTVQRKINFIWEFTQATIAILVTGSTLYVAASLALKGEGETAAFLLLSNAFFVVVSTYLSRTNHQKIGGVK